MTWRRHAAVVALATVVAGALYGWLLWRAYPTLGGDEPHYVLTARSIVEDGDVDLRNDYAEVARWGPVYPGNARLDASVSAFDYRGDGTLRRVHNVGLPLVLAPSQWVKPGFRSAQATMVAVAAATMAALLSLLLRLARRWWAAVAVWAVVALTLPVLAFSNQVYPEMPAALVLVAAAHLLLSGRRWALVATGALASLLPWLHVRYWLLVPVVVGFALWRLKAPSADGPAPASRAAGSGVAGSGSAGGGAGSAGSAGGAGSVGWWGWRVGLVGPMVVSAVLLAVFFQRWYGSPLPSAPYDVAAFKGAARVNVDTVYRLGVGSLFNPSFGLVPYSPVLWLGLVGVGAAVARWGRAALAAAAGAGMYVVVVAVANGAAFSLPARFLIPIVPLLAVALLALVELGTAALAAFGLLSLANVAIAVPVPTRFGDLYDLGAARYPPVVRVERLFPVPDDLGLVSLDAPAEAFLPRRPGVVGMVAELRPGPWELRPLLADGPPVRMRIIDLSLRRTRLDGPVSPGQTLHYRSTRVRPVEIELHGLVPDDPRLQGLTGRLTGSGATKPPARFPDWPKAAAWLGATVVGAVAAFWAARRARSR